MEHIIKTQKELDSLKDVDGYVYVEGGTSNDPLVLKTQFQSVQLVVRGSASVVLYGNATVRSVSDNATVRSVSDNATVRSVSGNATVESVSDNATVRSVSGNATVRSVSDNATVRSVSGNAILNLFGEAVISNVRSAKAIVLRGYNTVIVHKSDKSKVGLVMNKESHLIILPDNTLATKPTAKEYLMRYGIETKGTKAIMYKAVHKKDGKYLSDKDSSFEYVIGQEKTEKCAPASEGSCSSGLHVSGKFWAFNFGRGWTDLAMLECEVAIKDIVVSKDTDGKVRTSKIKVIRELNKNEY